MHRAILNDDIFHIILQNVKTSPTDLRNVALTCSTLSAPALDMLWCEQSNLAHLIMCLPEDTWEIGDYGTINILREPLLAEWERVIMNASRIRSIVRNWSLVYDDVQKLRGPLLQRLFRLWPPTLLFPNLRALHFDALSDVSSDFCLLRKFF
ncbi:hypothetical protein DEU56DRAFT_913659 [Suillus clintonianus]|uniref:uncharacterized protein n=1 Tax=Suillus clintonianus TaxID=1904413 RepID=UPI001B883CA0|nr:uncharacterized protein DEU56DRAFT_913659 [Suillus clintonianus]KAG2134471.1 hypothetical protein DEU56DRAFT_913659 [Suillus clintonianus]